MSLGPIQKIFAKLKPTGPFKIADAVDIEGLLDFRLDEMQHGRWSHRLVAGNDFVLGMVERATGRFCLALTADSLIPLGAAISDVGTKVITNASATGWLLRFIMGNNRIWGGVQADGTAAVPALNIGNGAKLEVLDPDKTGYFLRLKDSAGNIRFGLDRSFNLVASHAAKSIFPGSIGGSLNMNYLLLGDSLLAQLGTTGIGGGGDATNLAVGGQADAIAARAGVFDATLTLSGNLLAASGNTDVTAYSLDLGFNGGYSAGWQPIPGTILNEPVNLVGRNNGTVPNPNTGTYYVQRVNPGPAITVPPGTAFHSTEADPYRDRIHIVGLGRNYGTTTSRIDDVLAHNLGIIEKMTDRNPRILFLDVPNGTNEAPAAWAAMNEKLALAANGRMLGRRRWLNQEAIYWAIKNGYLSSPTSDDLTAIANDWLPPSLGADFLHLNAIGIAALKWFINYNLKLNGWYKP